MRNPFAVQAWPPYAVGAGLGVLSWFAFATTDNHLAITLQYEHVAAMVIHNAEHYAARAAEGLEPRVGWYLMLLIGVFIGARWSAWLSGDGAPTGVPALWQWRFGASRAKRFACAFAGGGLMVLGARIAGGCTSGHGISGSLQLAAQSWGFILLAFAVAIATAFLIFGREGRRHV